MAAPRQKSVELPSFLTRILPAWVSPMWTDSARWRQVVRNQPVAIICRDRLITYAQAVPWDIRAKKTSDQDALEADIAYYKEHILGDFDLILDLMWQDALDLPIGGNVEIVRWPIGVQPTVDVNGEKIKPSRPHPLGHPDRLVHIDGGTFAPTYDRRFPYIQRLPGEASRVVYFEPQEIGRIVLTPRPEMRMKGYGMPPPQRIFLALTLLFRGDQYYANLLLDTPEAGVLDLINMKEDAAEKWVSSFRNLMEGIDPFKIGVLHSHTQAAAWIPFGRPPTEMMFDATTTKYARVTTAGYWLRLSDIGLEPGSSTMAGKIRDQKELRLTGFGLIREKTKNFIDKQVLPPYLEFYWKEADDEAAANKGRARLVNAQASKVWIESGVMTPEEAQDQMIKDGLVTIELAKPKEPEPAPPNGMLPAGSPRQLPSPEEQARKEADKVPTEQGGRGEAGVQRGPDAGDLSINAAPFNQMEVAVRQAFSALRAKMGDPQLRRLVKAAVKVQFPLAAKTLTILPPEMRAQWADERALAWAGEPSLLDAIDLVARANGEIGDEMERVLLDDPWWELPEEVAQSLVEPIKAALAEGAVVAAQEIYRFLYEENILPSPDPIGLNFQLKNPQTLAEIEASGAELVRRVNDGTKSFLRRIILSGVDAGLSSDEIALRIQEGQDLPAILRETNFTDAVAREARKQVEGMLDFRVKSIVNTEIARAETEGRRLQWRHIGLQKKRWVHTGSDIPCPYCRANIERGLIDIDEPYDSVFGDKSVQGPPAHPTVDHCHIEFDEEELMALAGQEETLSVWDGS